MVVRDPGQEEKTRQTPRAEGGEGARSAAPEARPSLTGGSVVCRWRVSASRHDQGSRRQVGWRNKFLLAILASEHHPAFSCPVLLDILTRSRLLVGLAVETEPGSIGKVVFGYGLSPRAALPPEGGETTGGSGRGWGCKENKGVSLRLKIIVLSSLFLL